MGFRAFREPFNRSISVWRSEGPGALLRQAWNFIWPQIFHKGEYYIYEHHTRQLKESDFKPAVPGLRCEIVCSNEDADRLEMEGLEFRSRFLGARSKLDAGGTAFCIFIEKKIACISWMALNGKAEKSFVHRGYKVDYSSSECCTGGAFTVPGFRNRGLMTYTKFKQLQFAYDKGIHTLRCAVKTDHLEQRKVNEKFAPARCISAGYVRLFFKEFYREKAFK